MRLDFRNHLRQGDVILIPVLDHEPAGTPVKASNGLLLIADGEATNHQHLISAADCTLVTDEQAKELWLIVHGDTLLQHLKGGSPTLDHDPLPVKKGTYLIGSPALIAGMSQTEYTPEALRNVHD